MILTNGANPCNVYWQVGSSATLGTNQRSWATSWPTRASPPDGHDGPRKVPRPDGRGQPGRQPVHRPGLHQGRRTTQGTPTTPGASGPTAPIGTPGTGNGAGNQPPPASRTTRRPRTGQVDVPAHTPAKPGTCTAGFSARVRGSYVKSVLFRLDGKRIATQAPLAVLGLRQGGRSRKAQGHGEGQLQGRDPRQDHDACATAAARPLRSSPAGARHSSPDEQPLPRPRRWGRHSSPSAPLHRASPRPPRPERPRRAPRLVVLLNGHVARSRPSLSGRRLEYVGSRRPLTHVRTVLPVIGRRVRAAGGPGYTSACPAARAATPAGSAAARPGGSTPMAHQARSLLAPGHRVPRRPRRAPLPRHRRRAIAPRRRAGGSSSRRRSPCPGARTAARSRWPAAPAPASCRSSRAAPARSPSTGPTRLPGALGTAVSHGCIRLSPRAITWLARRMAGGTPLTVTR